MSDRHLSQLSIVIYDGHFDKIHYGLAMAAAAAAIDVSVTLFFTMDAAKALMKPGDDGLAAWRNLPVSQGGGDGGNMDDGFATEKIGTFEELLAACLDFGVVIMVCDMGLKARGLSAGTLRDDIPITSGGLVTFLSNARSSGSLIFI